MISIAFLCLLLGIGFSTLKGTYIAAGEHVPRSDDMEIVSVQFERNSSGRSKREASQTHLMKLNAFGKNYELYLEPNDHVLYGNNTPLYLATAHTTNNGQITITHEKKPFPLLSNVRLFQDHSSGAAVTVHEDNDGLTHVNGIMGNGLSIRSLPARLRRSVSYSSGDHMVYKIPLSEENIGLFQSNMNGNSFKFSSDEGNADHSNFVYPKLLVTVDYETYDYHDKNPEAVAQYMIAFWNAVDLRYRELRNPKVRLNIAGLIIATNPDASYYLDHSIHYSDLLTYMRYRYFKQEEETFPSDSYDIIIGIIHGKHVPLAPGIGGIATGEVCEKIKATEIVSDAGRFDNILFAAHELGHSLGVDHDDNCTSSNYIMHTVLNPKQLTETNIHWSQCSKQQLTKFLSSDKARCLYNKPNLGKPYPKMMLPGKYFSREDICKSRFGPGYKVHTGYENDCMKLICEEKVINPHTGKPIGINVKLGGVLPEGLSCGNGKICLDGKCVPDIQ